LDATTLVKAIENIIQNYTTIYSAILVLWICDPSLIFTQNNENKSKDIPSYHNFRIKKNSCKIRLTYLDNFTLTWILFKFHSYLPNDLNNHLFENQIFSIKHNFFCLIKLSSTCSPFTLNSFILLATVNIKLWILLLWKDLCMYLRIDMFTRRLIQNSKIYRQNYSFKYIEELCANSS
jgi:hypothetical protein